MVTQNACPHCAAELPSEAQFCHQCGNKLNAKLRCPHCSAELIAGSKFCGGCGRSITSDDQPEGNK
jgi:predicted amidophosphoribosyltransferase